MNKFVKYVVELFTLKGRISRSGFIFVTLILVAPLLIYKYQLLLSLATSMATPLLEYSINFLIWHFIFFIICPLYLGEMLLMFSPFMFFQFTYKIVLLFWAYFATINCIKRLHDIGKTGLWAILFFVPLLDLFFFLFLAIKKGTSGPNEYGEKPAW